MLASVGRKGSNQQRLAARVIRQPDLLGEILDGLSAEKPGIKYGCAKILNIISEKNPAILGPELDFFIDLLDSDNKILKWNAIIIIGNLAAVDSKRKIDKTLHEYLQPIGGPELVTATNVIGGAARIALAKPRLTDPIVKGLLKVSRARYRTPECRNVALGKAIEAFDMLYDQIEHRDPVIRLVKRQLKSPRNATRKKAERFVRRRLSRNPAAS